MKKLTSFVIAFLLTMLCVTSAFADAEVSPSTVITLLQGIMESDDSIEYDYEYNEASGSYMVYITKDGLIADALTALSDSDKMEDWLTLRDNMVEMSDSIIDLISTVTGDDAPILVLSIRNDENPDNIIMSMLNSTIIYDAITGVDTTSSNTGTVETKNDTAAIGEKNALKTAKNYLEYTAFSYTGLIDQLEYEGFSKSESTYGADNCGADWKEQALKCAKNYLDYTAFSYSGLIDQLEYEGFLKSESTYEADNCGADWNEQAVKCAKSYLDYSSFSKKGLIEQLEYEGFTKSQATYGAEQNGY